MTRASLFAVLLMFGLSGCYYDVAEELYPGTSCDISNTTYSATIEPIISSNCAVPACHVPGGTSPDLSTYTGASTNASGIEQRALIDKDMPPSAPLPACDQLKLQAWIDAGAPNN